VLIYDSVKSASILIVDDQEANVALLADVLTRHGFTDLRSTTDAREVVALFGERQPDLILLDVMMPHLSGLEVMERLKPLIPPGDYLPILVLTADVTPETKRRALSGGAKDFLAKPLDSVEVVLRVRNLLETRLLHLQLRDYNALLEEKVRERTAEVLEREARQRAVLEALPDLMYVQDAEGVFLDYHASDPNLLFAPPERFLGKSAAEVLPADLAAKLERTRRAVLKARQVRAVEYALPMPTGTAYFEARYSPSGDDQTVAMVRNVTQRRHADQLMAALNGVASNMALAVTRDDAFSVLRQELKKLGMDCMMFLAAEDGRVLIPRYVGYSAKTLAAEEKLAGMRREDYRLIVDDSDLYRHVMREREPRFVSDITKMLKPLLSTRAGRFAGAIAEIVGVSHLIVAPVVVGGSVIAVLSVQSRELTEEDVPAVSAFAHQVAAAWRMTELYEQALLEISERKAAEERVRTQLGRLASLRVIDTSISGSADLPQTLDTILEEVTERSQVDAADLLLFDPHTETLTYAAGRGFRGRGIEGSRLRLGECYAGRAVRERRLVHVTSLPERGRTFLRTGLLAGEGFIAYHAAPLIAKNDVVGVLEVFHRGPREDDEEWRAFLETLAGQAAIAVENARLFEGLQRANTDLKSAYDATIEGWSRALDLRDKETEGHSERVTAMTVRLARAMGLGDDEIAHVRRGALLHDIGKMGVPDSVLLKPGPLTEDEWASMRRHPQYAFDLLSPIDYLRPALDIPHRHHERWDGVGYPSGLKGEEIPLAARLFAVVDVWDALRSDRPYRPRWPEEKTLAHVRSGSGTHFDPAVVDVFLRTMSAAAAQESTERAPA